jgi:large subunit ribosomal protein L24
MAHVRRGDLVVVLKGKDKGKQGKVLRIVGERVVIEKVAMVKRHSKPSPQKPEGGIIEKEGTVHLSNVALYDEKTKRGTRTKVVVDGDKKIRVGVKSGTRFSSPGL